MSKEKKNKKPWYMHVYATGHGMPSHLIMHVGYSQCKDDDTYPTWYSKPITLTVANKVYERTSYRDGSNCSMDDLRVVRNQIENI